MRKKIRAVFLATLITISLLTVSTKLAYCWSNGGYSDNPLQPDYGTHDWIAQHALDWLDNEEKQYITDNLATYLYGTELPDNYNPPDGIGDTGNHHVYFYPNGVTLDDDSAVRASEEYQKALNFLANNDYVSAAKTAGIMSHYIVDIAVFGHVMGSSTDWGTEIHHTDYENYVRDRTTTYSSIFDSYLLFDETLSIISAYNATINLAWDTTFDADGELNCTWMDANYDWSNAVFTSRCGESLNLAVNLLADVLHTLYLKANPSSAASPSPTPTPSPNSSPTPSPTISSSPSPSLSPLPTLTPPPEEQPLVLYIIVMAIAFAAIGAAAFMLKRRR